jgi:hypothetical protein
MKTSLKSFSEFITKLRQNVSLALVIVLLVLLVCEGLVVRHSLQILLNSQHVEIKPKTPAVRVNFNLYNSIAERFGQQTSFTPTSVAAKDPFGLLDFKPVE